MLVGLQPTDAVYAVQYQQNKKLAGCLQPSRLAESSKAL